MKKVILFLFLLFVSQSIFAQIRLDSSFGFMRLMGQNLFFGDLETECQMEDFGFSAGGTVVTGKDIDLHELTNTTITAEQIDLLNLRIAPFYKNNLFFIQPYFMFSQIGFSESKISYFSGNLNFPDVMAFGSKIGFLNHQLDVSFFTGNGNFTSKNDKKSEDIDYTILQTKQSMLNARYDFFYKNNLFSLDSFLNYLYISGNFDGVVTKEKVPDLLTFPFYEFSYKGNDEIHIIGAGGKVKFSKTKIDFVVNLANYFVINEELAYKCNFDPKTGFFNNIILISMGLLGKNELDGAYNKLSQRGLFYADINIEFFPFENRNLELFLQKPVFIPYKIGSSSDLSSIDEKLVELVLTSFSLGLSIHF